MRKKAGTDNEVSAHIDSDVSRKAFRKNWARLIKKIYEVDLLTCPKSQGRIRFILSRQGHQFGPFFVCMSICSMVDI